MKYQGYVRGREAFIAYSFVPLLFWSMWAHYLLKKTQYQTRICYYKAISLSPNIKHSVWHLTDVQILRKIEPEVKAYISITLERGVVSRSESEEKRGMSWGKERKYGWCVITSKWATASKQTQLIFWCPEKP